MNAPGGAAGTFGLIGFASASFASAGFGFASPRARSRALAASFRSSLIVSSKPASRRLISSLRPSACCSRSFFRCSARASAVGARWRASSTRASTFLSASLMPFTAKSQSNAARKYTPSFSKPACSVRMSAPKSPMNRSSPWMSMSPMNCEAATTVFLTRSNAWANFWCICTRAIARLMFITCQAAAKSNRMSAAPIASVSCLKAGESVRAMTTPPAIAAPIAATASPIGENKAGISGSTAWIMRSPVARPCRAMPAASAATPKLKRAATLPATIATSVPLREMNPPTTASSFVNACTACVASGPIDSITWTCNTPNWAPSCLTAPPNELITAVALPMAVPPEF